MKNYLVCTMNKDTGEVNFKYIETEDDDDSIIEEYIDSMGYVLWAIYPSSVPYDKATADFAKYTKYKMQQIEK